MLTVLTALDRIHNHRIGRRREQQAASWMTGLPPSLLAAFLAQTLGLSLKAIRGRGQMAVVAILLELFLQGLHLLTQLLHLVLHLDNLFIPLRKLLLQEALFFSQVDQFFFGCHGATVSALLLFDKLCRTPE